MSAFLSKLSETVDWEYGAGANDAPWLQHRQGREGTAAFFASLDAIEIHKSSPKTFLEGEQIVVALVDIEFTVKATGKRVTEEDEVHIWRFDSQGKVIRFWHRLDTHKHALGCRS